MQITIKMLTGESLTLAVSPQDTVGSLKTKIQERSHVPANRQRLVFDNGHRTFLDDNSQCLSSYSLKDGSQVSLLVTQAPPIMEVFLRTEKGTHTYEVQPDETVNNFKMKVEKREGVAVSQQRLVFQGRDMTAGKLSDYKVENHSTIELTMRLRGG